MKKLLMSLVLSVFVPWVGAASIDLTANEWDFDAGLYAGPVVVAGDLNDSTLLFNSQTPATNGFELQGAIEWVLNGSPVATNSVFGVYDGAESIAFFLDSPGGVWALFEGFVDPIAGNYMVGTLEGLFEESFNGFWTATKGIERSGPAPIALPTSALLLMSALGIGFIMVRRS